MNETTKSIYNFILEFITNNPWPPSVREIKEALGISSVSVVTYHLNRLERTGYIRREPGIARGLSVTDKQPDF